MELYTVSAKDVRRVMASRLDVEDLSSQGVDELLRASVTARAGVSRSSAIRHVIQLMELLSLDCAETVADAQDALVQCDEIVLARGGKLFPTPIRAVDLGNRRFRIFSSQPTHRLCEMLGGTWEVTGATRHCTATDTGDFMDRVSRENGLVLSPETWAGLNSSPVADAAWIADLDRRLDQCAVPAGTGDHDGELAWQSWWPTELPPRWKNDTPDGRSLWRACNLCGYWRFAWTAGSSPATAAFVDLQQDDAVRTMFATAGCTGHPIEAAIVPAADHARLEISEWLPRAEYRAISIYADAFEREGRKSVWILSPDKARKIAEMLRNRLAMQITGIDGFE